MEREILTEIHQLQKLGKPIVLANGCFDLLHVGHLRLLRRAARMGTLIVAVDSDRKVQILKGVNRPIVPAPERIEMLEAIRYVSKAFVFDRPVAEVVHAIKPDVLVKGADWKKGVVEGAEDAGQLLFIEHTGHSVTDIIERILQTQ